EAAASGWRSALLGAAWDGEWFLRAWFDDGSPLGAERCTEARIDLIAQAWSVLSGAAPQPRQDQALAAVEQHLVDGEAGLVRLLDPPFAHSDPSPGYIQAYPPGVRENGGQYAHAAVWALMAVARNAVEHGPPTGPALMETAGNRVYRQFCWLSPAHRSANAQQSVAYGLEPYAMAGDICSQPPHTGRGGWSWYTGAAAWLHRAAVESMFGLSLQARRLRLQPCLPTHWPQAELILQREHRRMRFIAVQLSPQAARASLASHHQPGCEAALLHPGEWLDWPGLPEQSCFVIPLKGDE
ncbi:GH36-type glycosyl hydrolase domain-containing protein, partial [Ideonella sp.]|uniref:GH36-type glycosyl hydrolase domain-containing protein n=1 Tax=Ideonella sp. TaxID=1929293 RepID=UPI003BB62014